jgi:hypothetical protein
MEQPAIPPTHGQDIGQTSLIELSPSLKDAEKVLGVRWITDENEIRSLGAPVVSREATLRLAPLPLFPQ